MKHILLVFIFIFSSLIISEPVFSFAGGAGTSGDPYQITTPSELAEMSSYLGSGHSSKYFALMNDIDLNVSPYNSDSGWTPIGTLANRFYGNFDGNGYSISNLYINTSTSYVGLFGFRQSGTISDVRIVNASVVGGSTTGILAGYGGGTYTNIFTSGSVTSTATSGGAFVGGIIGRAFSLTMTDASSTASVGHSGTQSWAGGAIGEIGSTSATIVNVSASGQVSGYSRVGGLFGEIYGSSALTVSSSYATGNVTASSLVGGFVGYMGGSSLTVSSSYATGNVTGSGSASYVGGFFGGTLSGPTIKTSYATGDVSAASGSSVGGFGGGYVSAPITIQNCYARGDVIGSSTVGGFIGNASSHTIANVYATGAVSGGSSTGGLIGTGGSGVTNSFWDTQTSGKSSSSAGTGTSTLAMKTQTTFTDSGWNFTSIWNIDGTGTDNDGYPYLRVQSFSSPDVTAPSIISLSPADNATSVASSTNFIITFDENITTSSGNFYLKKSSDNSTIETFNVASSTLTASSTTAIVLNPTNNLESETGYYITADAGTVKDSSNNNFAGISATTTWSITTADSTNPTISSLSPNDNATDVLTTAHLILTFSEPIATSTGYVTIYTASDDTIVESFDVATSGRIGISDTLVTIDLTTALDEQTNYYALVSSTAFIDSADNAYAGISATTTWNFTTADETAPYITTLSPADDATNIAIDSNLSITFSESVDVQTGNITIKKSSDDTTIETIDITNSTLVSGSGGTTITINPSTNLSNDTSYYILLDATALDDINGVSFAGISATTTWNFATVAAPINESSGSGNLAATLPATVGLGGTNYWVPMHAHKAIQNPLTIDGINTIMMIGSSIDIHITPSNKKSLELHRVTIIDVHPGQKTVTLTIASKPQTVSLTLGDSTTVDLDGDGTHDMRITFANLVTNRAEITLTHLKQSTSSTTTTATTTTGTESTSFPPTPFLRDLTQGMTGDDVRHLQQLLNRLSFTVALTGPGSKGYETTYFGPATDTAVKALQQAHGLPQDGIITDATRDTLDILFVGSMYYNEQQETYTIPYSDNTNIPTLDETQQTPFQYTDKLFPRNLEEGMFGEDVYALQVYLNTHNFPITLDGPGSKGNETNFFGSLTRSALIKFQTTHGLPNIGFFGPITRTYIQKNR